MNVPFVDLQIQTLNLKSELLAAVDRVLESTRFSLGPEVEALEDEFAALSGARYAVAVNTGTSALQLALQVAGVGKGDEVITVPMTFVASAAAITYLGAQPVFVDVEPGRYTMDPARIEAAITPRTKAIVPVHLYGQPADLGPILEIAAHHRLEVVEDSAQAHLATYRGQTAGTWGKAGAISFYPGKNLGACGEGGLLFTQDPELATTARQLRDWGQTQKSHHDLPGYNFRMDAVQAAMLRVKLPHLREWTERRQTLARRYGELLADLPLTLPEVAADCTHVFHLYTVLCNDRDAVQAALLQRGVHTGIHYPIPVHLQKAYNDRGYRPGDFPVAEDVARRTLSLPLFPEMTHEQQDAVAAALAAVLQQRSPS